MTTKSIPYGAECECGHFVETLLTIPIRAAAQIRWVECRRCGHINYCSRLDG